MSATSLTSFLIRYNGIRSSDGTTRADAEDAASPLSKRVVTAVDLDAIAGLAHLELPDPSSSAPLHSAPPTSTSFSFFGSSHRQSPRPHLAPAVQSTRHSLDPESLRGPSLDSHRSSCDAQLGSEASASSASRSSCEAEISRASEGPAEGPLTLGCLPGDSLPRFYVQLAGEVDLEGVVPSPSTASPIFVQTPPPPSSPSSHDSGVRTPLAGGNLPSRSNNPLSPPLHSVSLPLLPSSPILYSSGDPTRLAGASFSGDMDNLRWDADAASHRLSNSPTRRSGLFTRATTKAGKEMRREAERKLGARAAGASEEEAVLRARSLGYVTVKEKEIEAKEAEMKAKEARREEAARIVSGGSMLGGHFAFH